MDMATAMHGYELDLQAEDKSSNTIVWYRSKLKYFKRFIDGSDGASDLQKISANQVKAFIRSVQIATESMERKHRVKDDTLSSFTARGYFVSIKAFLNWAVREGYLSSNPTISLNSPKLRQAVIESFTPDEVRAMLKSTSGTRHAERD